MQATHIFAECFHKRFLVEPRAKLKMLTHLDYSQQSILFHKLSPVTWHFQHKHRLYSPHSTMHFARNVYFQQNAKKILYLQFNK